MPAAHSMYLAVSTTMWFHHTVQRCKHQIQILDGEKSDGRNFRRLCRSERHEDYGQTALLRAAARGHDTVMKLLPKYNPA